MEVTEKLFSFQRTKGGVKMTRQEKIETIKNTLGLTGGQLKAMLAADELPGEQDKRLNRLFKDAGKVLNQQAGLNEEDLEFSF